MAFIQENLPKTIKNGAYVINLDEYADVGTHWNALYVKNNEEVVYFDSFGVEYIPKEIKKFIGNKDIKANYSDYRHMIRSCVVIFALSSLILCSMGKV